MFQRKYAVKENEITNYSFKTKTKLIFKVTFQINELIFASGHIISAGSN